MSLLIMAICSWAQPYPESSYEIEGGYLKKWKGTETEIDFTKDPVLKNLYRISGSAFQNNKTLVKVTFSMRINILEHRAFENCENLKEVIFEEGTDWEDPYLEISEMAFDNCPKLEKLHIPRQYRTVKDESNGNIYSKLGYMFENCNAITTVTISAKHPILKVYQGAVYNKNSQNYFTFHLVLLGTSQFFLL